MWNCGAVRSEVPPWIWRGFKNRQDQSIRIAAATCENFSF